MHLQIKLVICQGYGNSITGVTCILDTNVFEMRFIILSCRPYTTLRGVTTRSPAQ